MKKILLSILLLTASTLIYSQSMDLNHKKIHIVDSTMGLGITPTSRLHVFGNGTASGLLNITNDKDATKDSSVIVKADGRVILGDSSWYLLNDYVSDSRLTIIGGTPLRLLNNAPFGYTSLKFSAMTDEDTIADYAQIMGNVEKNTFGLHSGSLYFQTALGGGLSTKMYIDSSGYVGIGTTTPTAKLHIDGNKLTPNNLLYITNDADATKDSTFVIKSNGFVGIGISAPLHPLHVYGSDNRDNIKSEYSGSYARAAIEGRASGSTGYGITGTAVTTGAKAGFFQNTAAGGLALEVRADNGIAINVKSGYVIADSTRFISRSTTLSDNEAYYFPTNLSWKGEIDVDSLGYTLFTAQIRCDADGTPYLERVSWKRWSSKTYAQVGSLDGYLNIIGTGSNCMVITNTLGYTIKATLRFRTKQ